MKIEFQTDIEAIEAMGADAMVSTRHSNNDEGIFLRRIQFGCTKEAARQLRLRQKVRVTVEVLDDDEPKRS